MMEVLLWPDTLAGSGLGHLARCSALAQNLVHRGEQVILVVSEGASLPPWVPATWSRVMALSRDSCADPSAIARLARDERVKAVVVDSYRAGLEAMEILRSEIGFVATIEDEPRFPYPVDLVVDASPDAGSAGYESADPETVFLLGALYAPLRAEFADVSPRRTAPRATSLLVTMGGDVRSYNPRLVRALADRGFERIRVVAGSFGADPTKVVGGVRGVEVVESPHSMATLYRDADVVLTAAGQTLFELAATGTPAVAVAVADNQHRNLRAFARRGTIRAVADDSDVEEQMLENLRVLVDDPAARAEMATAGRRLVDGLGAGRVAEVLSREIAERS